MKKLRDIMIIILLFLVCQFIQAADKVEPKGKLVTTWGRVKYEVGN